MPPARRPRVTSDGLRNFFQSWVPRGSQPNNNNNNAVSPMAAVLSAVISAAMTRAAPNYMPLTRQANQQVFILGTNPLPDGPYRTAVNP